MELNEMRNSFLTIHINTILFSFPSMITVAFAATVPGTADTCTQDPAIDFILNEH